MTPPIWWTTADEAELDIRIHDTISHVHACQHPAGGSVRLCKGCREAIEGLCQWRDRRILQSRAEYERAYANLVLEAAEAA